MPGAQTQYVKSFGGLESRKPHAASVIVNVGENAHFDVIFCPNAVQRSQAYIRLTVVGNQYEDSVVQLVGEGYQDDVTIENIRNFELINDEGNMADDDVTGKCKKW